MENKQEMQEWMARLEKQAQRQTKYARWQCLFTAACLAVLLAAALILVPKAASIEAQTEVVIDNLASITTQLNEADLEGLVKSLNEADINSLVENMNRLAVNSQDSIQEAMERFSSLDFDTLNQAIQDLANVVEPMSRFFGMFN